MLEPEGEHADGAVTAHGQAAAGLDEQDAAVRVGACGWIKKPAAHHVVPARLEAQAGADPVETFHEVETALGHGCAMQQWRAAGHQSHRVAGGVAIDAEERGTHGAPKN
jgi:hypothetical protein